MSPRRRKPWALGFVDRLLCAQEHLFARVHARDGVLEPDDVLEVAAAWTTEVAGPEGWHPDGDWALLVSALDEWADE